MGQTVKELLYDAVEYDEPFLAHAVYYAVQQKFVSLEDSIDQLNFEELDHEAVIKMRDENYLSMCTIKLFTIQIEPRRFAFYLAEKEDEARSKHYSIYGQISKRVIDMTDKMDTSLYCHETKRVESFRELKKRTMQFPCFAGEYFKERG